METKICTKCKKAIIQTGEFFPIDKRTYDGLGARCRSCVTIVNKERYKYFPQKSKEYRESHKEQLKKNKHEYYLKNIERQKEKRKKYYLEHREEAYRHAVEWKKDNPDKLTASSHKRYEKVKEHHKELTRKWKQDHKEERNIAWQARRAKKKSLEYSLTPEQWEQTKIYFENKCCYCGKEQKLTQDHFVPLEKNGEYSRNNILPACQTCNSSKANKSFFEWYPKYQFYSEERLRHILEFLGYN
jgi:hypothetical protein